MEKIARSNNFMRRMSQERAQAAVTRHAKAVTAYNRAMTRWGLALVVVAACYSPHPPEGAPCDVDSQCPSPQHCVQGACSTHDAAVDSPQQPPPEDTPPPELCVVTGLPCAIATTFECGGDCWVRCDDTVDRDTARSACASWGGALAVLHSPTEQDCAEAHVLGKTWIGLQQASDAPVLDEDWTWGVFEPVIFDRWQTGAPNDADNIEDHTEQCGHIQADGTWDDEACTSLRAYFCQR